MTGGFPLKVSDRTKAPAGASVQSSAKVSDQALAKASDPPSKRPVAAPATISAKTPVQNPAKVLVAAPATYAENRVKVGVYGSLPSDSPLLVPVATTTGRSRQRMHVVAASKLAAMSEAVLSSLGFSLLVASGWRPHRWTSFEQYRQSLIEKYKKPGLTDDEAFRLGRTYLAFDSPHETGLAADFGCGGLLPVSATITKQRTTALWKWLRDNAWSFGFTPYISEPWHWECNIPLSVFRSGKEKIA